MYFILKQFPMGLFVGGRERELPIRRNLSPVPGSRSVRTIEKASGRQAGTVASGIRERKEEGQTPLVAHPLFQFSALTESLEQAKEFGVSKYKTSCKPRGPLVGQSWTALWKLKVNIGP